ncbi:AAA family ATPase [Nostoc sp. FACHB-190]|uniref:trifunctional serine/threonine-protein kinase/ATP-binding protein/sensor histidine kinase n=1 Tax=Nostoc sp. FACHB-190 TaxID=2692838 RepID=UPI001683AC6D|nr:AAA family ATPase [Nostoc sp. FACHB-190]MBD2299609.1 AAA family ATPase [Nostoc sp. FACHB-190]
MLAVSGYQFSEILYDGLRTLVYRGYREIDNKPVVVKLLKNPYPSFNELVQFRNQYTIAKNLHKPGIIETYSLESYQNGYAIVMEDMGGIALKDYFTATKRQSPEFLLEFLEIAIALCSILDTLYRDGIIHKDIKPSNIVINPDTKQVKIIDFSIASLLPKETQTLINPHVLEGTLAYISPEQTGRMNRLIDYRTDFYSLGVTFYELLTGELPFPSTDVMELLHCHIAKIPPALVNSAEIPQVVSEIVLKLMAKNAEDRYQSALGIKYDLENCLTQLHTTGRIKSFQIAQRDICDRFTIPEKLYGRELEVETLLTAFDCVANGSTEIMLVAGFSGIGKTAVVNEVHKPIVRQRGYFIKGKFDQFNRNIPFSAFVQAFRDLMGQLLTESDDKIQQWQHKITEELGENAQVILEVIPELELIIGKQPPAPELSGNAAQNRFNLLFQKFIKLFSASAHPLVIFLDDLQWIDSASLKLMQSLMSEAHPEYLLLIGAYRDNEVSAAHHLILALDDIAKNGTTINTITLKELDELKLNQLVADTLICSETLALPISQLIYQKTQGNPFFTTQFLKSLHQDKLIYFNYEQGHWECNIAAINQRSLTSDVVEFMALQIQKLPETTQEILKLAACVGNQFDLETLAIVSQKSQPETATSLWSALKAGLILPQSDVYKFFISSDHQNIHQNTSEIITYKFLHDRIQQAAYSLIPEEHKQRTHLHIGQLLLNNTPKNQREEKIFAIVNQLNWGIKLLATAEQRDELAHLNLNAAQKAKASTAYSAAWEYCTFSLQLLPENSWQYQYEFTLKVYETAIEAAYLSGDFPEMERLSEVLLQQAKTILDTITVYEVKTQALIAQNQALVAIKIVLKVLQLLGVEFPENLAPNDIGVALQETQLAYQGQEIESLINLPLMTDPVQLAILRLISSILPAAFLTSPILYVLLTFKEVKISVESGNHAISTHSYGCYAAILSGGMGDSETGYKFGQLALDLLHKLNIKELQCKVNAMVYGFIKHWQDALSTTLKPLRDAYTIGLETGDFQFAGYSAVMYCAFAYFGGIEKDLSELQQEVLAFHDSLYQIKQNTSVYYLKMLQQALQDCQTGRSSSPYLQGEFFDEQIILSQYIESNDRLGLFYINFHKLFLNYLLGDYQQAIVDAAATAQYLDGAVGFPYIPLFYFYDSLAHIEVYKEKPHLELDELLKKIAENQQKMKNWADKAPMNYLHKFELVAAECHQLLNNYWEAIESYDRAIEGAKNNGYICEAALANELLARFYLKLNKENAAQGYMQAAYYGYARWGAKAKTDDLEKRYPQLLKPIQQQQRLNFNPLETIATIAQTSTSNSTNITDAIDFVSVLKAAQTISSTIELDELIAGLTEIILENSGAKKAVLILPEENGVWQVKAITKINRQVSSQGKIETTINPEAIETCLEIPATLINYVKNTQKTVVIDNCKTDIPGIIGEYMQTFKPGSVLGKPIIYHGHLVGIVYLENKLTSGVFHSDRLEIIQMLSAQAAISLENARLYRESQEKAQLLQQTLQQQKTLFEVVTQIRQSLNLEAIFCAVTQNIRQILHTDRVGIYQFHLETNYEYGEFIAEDVLPSFTSALAVKVQDHCFGEEFATLYKQGRYCAIDDINTDAVVDCHREILVKFQVKASLVVPIMQDDELWGLLCIHQCDRPRHWQPFEIQFAQQIGAQMGVALKQADLLIETQKQATELEQTLQHLQHTQIQLVQHEKMSALGNLVSGVAHEMNNPLGFISASLAQAKPMLADIIQHLNLYQESLNTPNPNIIKHAQEIDLDYTLEDIPQMISAMILACDRLKSISTSLRTFSRADRDCKALFNIHEGIDSTILILKHRLKANNQRPAIVVITDYGDLPNIECFPGQLNQVFMNILANAIDALDESNDGRKFAEIEAKANQIKITTSVLDQQVIISIADNGKGMTEEVKQKIFDHLFTTKGVGKGTGLGLAIARQIVEETHNGKLICNSVLGEGTEFILHLPV